MKETTATTIRNFIAGKYAARTAARITGLTTAQVLHLAGLLIRRGVAA